MRTFSRASTVALFALLAPLAPAAALAAAATTSQPANLRSGPATSYDVTGRLSAGQAVDVRQCEGTFCQVSYDGKTGWISASFLTRGTTPSATTAPEIVAVAPPKPAPAIAAPPTVLPPAYTATPGTAPIEPQIAGITAHKPRPAASTSPPVVLPPAYATPPRTASGEPQIAAITVHKPKPAASVSPTVLPRSYATAPVSVLPATDDQNSSDSSVPRPKVDVPGDAMGAPGDDGDFASTDDPGDDAAFAPDDNASDDGTGMAPPPDFGPRGFARRGFRRDFAGLDNGPSRACLVDADDGNGFCVSEGERIAAPGRWARHTLLLRNPQHLTVVVCAADGDCHNYLGSGPVLVGGRPIASISVAAPGY